MRGDSADQARTGGDHRQSTKGRIDLCLASLNVYPDFAGPAIRFRRYAPGLRERDVDMRMFTAARAESVTKDNDGMVGDRTPESTADDEADHPWERNRLDGFPVYRTRPTFDPASMRGWWEYQSQLVDFCRNESTQPDVLQLLTVDPWSTYYLYQLGRLGIPRVYTHTMLNTMSSRPWKRALQRIYWPLPYRFLDCTVVSSSIMRDALREIGVRGRIDVIPNGTDLQRFRPSSRETRRELRRRLDLEDYEWVILFVGTISPRKGVDALLEAWNIVGGRHENACLVMVGPRRDEIRPGEDMGGFFTRLERTLERSEAARRVIFTGAVDNVEDYYRAADVFVFPSKKEGMPNVVPEAYACGLPVVMTPFQGLPEEFGRKDVHHMLVERDPASIADAVTGLLAAPERRQELGARARNWAERELALETALDRYASLYRELGGGFNGKR